MSGAGPPGQAGVDRSVAATCVASLAAIALLAAAAEPVAGRIAERSGIDADRPRGLSKVTRTV